MVGGYGRPPITALDSKTFEMARKNARRSWWRVRTLRAFAACLGIVLCFAVPGETRAQAVGGEAGAVLAEIRRSGATAAFFTELADAIVVEAAARSQKLSVPGDLSIIVLGSHIRPQLSGTRFATFSIPREAMARAAVQMLAERIEAGSAGKQVVLPCDPIEGETLGPAPKHKGPK